MILSLVLRGCACKHVCLCAFFTCAGRASIPCVCTSMASVFASHIRTYKHARGWTHGPMHSEVRPFLLAWPLYHTCDKHLHTAHLYMEPEYTYVWVYVVDTMGWHMRYRQKTTTYSAHTLHLYIHTELLCCVIHLPGVGCSMCVC
jgi:hypothetical protein